MDSETAQMVKSTVTENGGFDNGGMIVGCNLSGEQCELNPPPFPLKTFEMVEDVETNSIISWNSNGTSFIVWDHNKFSAEVLPRHFKTSNFSSFVYQLNNYGFKKISWERYEYANRWFQAGQKHWLKNIKRRNQQSQATKKRGRSTLDHDMINATMGTKLEAMMMEQNDMKQKIQKLRESLDNLEDQLAILKTNVGVPELKDEKMNNAVFLKQFIQYLGEKNVETSGDTSKRPRRDGPESTESRMLIEYKVEIPAQNIFSSADDSGNSIQDQKVIKTTENCPFWNNMVEDEAGRGDLAAHHSKAIMELDEMMASNIAMQREILIAKPSDADLEEDGQLQLWT